MTKAGERANFQRQEDSKTHFQLENSRAKGDKENIIEEEDLKAPKDLEDTFCIHTHTNTPFFNV